MRGSEGDLRELLRQLLERRGHDLGSAAAGADAFPSAFAAASRRFGTAELRLDRDEHARLLAAGVTWPVCRRVDELGRIAMLVGCTSESGFDDRVADCYRHGDTAERIGVLRTLPLLPAGAPYLAIALDACRTHVRPIFEAIACENPYPAAHFAESGFNQMVLKAVFLEVAVARIIGLRARCTGELARMADDYARERRAAGRTVPADLALLMEGTE